MTEMQDLKSYREYFKVTASFPLLGLQELKLCAVYRHGFSKEYYTAVVGRQGSSCSCSGEAGQRALLCKSA